LPVILYHKPNSKDFLQLFGWIFLLFG